MIIAGRTTGQPGVPELLLRQTTDGVRAGRAAAGDDDVGEADVAGLLSQAVRRCGVRRSRYVGLARIHLGHILAATAVNFIRVGEWLAGTPRAETRRPPFAAVLAPPAAA
jgi:hypothetical protein